MASTVVFGNVLEFGGGYFSHRSEFNAFNLSDALEFLDLFEHSFRDIRVHVDHGDGFAWFTLTADLHGGDIDFAFAEYSTDVSDDARFVHIGIDDHRAFGNNIDRQTID